MKHAEHNFEQEEHLTGGNTAESVLRLGSTVRKPVTPSTPAVHSFIAHLRAAGFEAVPEVFGLDDQGRQVLEYVPGSLFDSKNHTPSGLRRVGAIIRELHRVAVSFQMPEAAKWNIRCQPDKQEIICHNDLAPWNLICGPDRWVFIDWDGAAPATRLWDLAWSAISFPPFKPECDLATAVAAMHELVKGYGLDRSSYAGLIGLMIKRARAEHNIIVEGAGMDQQPWVRLHAEGHHHYWGPVADYIDRNASAIEALLISLGRSDAF